jgi:predicted ferric reductase
VRRVIWLLVGAALVAPVALAATSPLLQWREPVYILASFAGIGAFALMVLQPLLAAGLLPGVAIGHGRRVHRWLGVSIVVGVVVHVLALWLTSPPDVIDALLLVSPTPFSDWGVMAMWAIFAAASLALLRRPLRLRPATWRIGHTVLVAVAVIGSAVHALLVDGTMETVSKAILCLLVLAGTAAAIYRLRAWTMLRRRGT